MTKILIIIVIPLFMIGCITESEHANDISFLLFEEQEEVNVPYGINEFYQNNFIVIKWNGSQNDLFYTIYISNNGLGYVILDTKISEPNYEIRNLKSGDYYIYVVAHDAFGNVSKPSKSILITVL